MHRNIVFAIAVFLTIAILIGSLLPAQQIPVPHSISDKIIHGSAYAVLTFFWLLAKPISKTGIVFGVFFLGALIELLQGTLTNNRHSEWLDVVANTIGIIVAFVAFKLFFEKK